jgi:hypothetical protein
VTCLFLMQFLFIYWCLVSLKVNYIEVGLFLLMLASGIASVIYVPSSKGLLIQSQLLFQISFLLALISLLPKIFSKNT